MDDATIRDRIEDLETEERRLRVNESVAASAGDDAQVATDARRLTKIAEELEGLWELLRRRQGARDGGEDPDRAGSA